MDAGAEGDVTVHFTVEDHLVGVGERGGVAVGGREIHQHPVAGVHRAAVVLEVLGDDAGHGDRRVGTQQFLDRHRHQLGLGHQAAAVVRMGGEMPQCGADGRPSGVDPRDQGEGHRAEDVCIGHRLAVDLGLQQLADQVVAGVGAPLGHEVEEIRHQLVAGLGAALLVVGELEQVAHPAGERVAHRLGHAEDQADHAHGDLLGVVGGGVGPALLDEAVHQPPAQLARVHLVLGHPVVREPGQDQPAAPRVHRRVAADRRHSGRKRCATGLGELLGRRRRQDADAARAEVLVIAGDRRDIGVGGGQPRPTPAFGVGDGAFPAELVPDTERVRDIPRVEDVVVGRPVRHRITHVASPFVRRTLRYP